MCDIESVKILNSIQNLIENSASCPLFQSDFSRHNFKQLPLLCILSDNVDVFSCLYDLIEVYDVGVPDFLHDLYLPLNSQLIILILNRFFIDNFNCYFFPCWNVNGLLNLSKSASTQSLPHFVIANSSQGFFL